MCKNKSVITLFVFCEVLFCFMGLSAGLDVNKKGSSSKEELEVPNKLVTAYKNHAHYPQEVSLFVNDVRSTLDKYILGLCPEQPAYLKMSMKKSLNATSSCDLDENGKELAGKFAELALRSNFLAKKARALGLDGDSQFTHTLAGMLGSFAKRANHSPSFVSKFKDSKNAAKSQRKMSKSQKKLIQAKQKTAIAVKNKAASRAGKAGLGNMAANIIEIGTQA